MQKSSGKLILPQRARTSSAKRSRSFKTKLRRYLKRKKSCRRDWTIMRIIRGPSITRIGWERRVALLAKRTQKTRDKGKSSQRLNQGRILSNQVSVHIVQTYIASIAERTQKMSKIMVKRQVKSKTLMHSIRMPREMQVSWITILTTLIFLRV